MTGYLVCQCTTNSLRGSPSKPSLWILFILPREARWVFWCWQCLGLQCSQNVGHLNLVPLVQSVQKQKADMLIAWNNLRCSPWQEGCPQDPAGKNSWQRWWCKLVPKEQLHSFIILSMQGHQHVVSNQAHQPLHEPTMPSWFGTIICVWQEGPAALLEVHGSHGLSWW